MAAVTIRNLSEEAHRALKVRAAQHNRSAEAEMRAILEAAVRPEGRLRLGTALSEMSRKIGLTNADVEALEHARETQSRRADALRMILLDTNVVSEAMKPEPHPRVRDWLDAQAAETLFLSSVTIAELLFGIGALPWHAQRQAGGSVRRPVGAVRGPDPALRLVAARHYADLAVKARAAGKGFPTPDGYIAAIAAAHQFAVASRDASAFKAAGPDVINPWAATALTGSPRRRVTIRPKRGAPEGISNPWPLPSEGSALSS